MSNSMSSLDTLTTLKEKPYTVEVERGRRGRGRRRRGGEERRRGGEGEREEVVWVTLLVVLNLYAQKYDLFELF